MKALFVVVPQLAPQVLHGDVRMSTIETPVIHHKFRLSQAIFAPSWNFDDVASLSPHQFDSIQSNLQASALTSGGKPRDEMTVPRRTCANL
jgi:hypothetical protein